MKCKVCGRETRPASGPSTRCVRYHVVGERTHRTIAPWEDPLEALSQHGGGCILAEVLCFRCYAWSTPGTAVFGKVYATR